MSSTCDSECDRSCEIGEYLKDCESTKSLVDNLGVIHDNAKCRPEGE